MRSVYKKAFIIYFVALGISLIISVFYTIRTGNRGTQGLGKQWKRESFPFLLEFSLKGEIVHFQWRVDWKSKIVEFNVTFPAEKISRVLIGFSDHGALVGSDFCLFDRDTRKMTDGWVDKKSELRKDLKDDCFLVAPLKSDEDDSSETASRSGNFRFRRRFTTCDPRDYAFEKGTTNVFVAVMESSENPKQEPLVSNLNELAVEMRYTQILNREELESTDRSRKVPLGLSWNTYSDTGSKTLDILAGNVTIPAQVTTYWCTIVELDESLKRKKHHAIKYEAVISAGNERLVHHFEVFHCQSRTETFRGDCSLDKPPEARSCSKVIAAWAMGANPVIYPPEAGMPIGGPDFIPFLMVEVHYNNVDRLKGAVDNSGIRITYTDRLRRYDAAIMELGLIYSDANSIPPGQTAFPMTGFCPTECTRKFNSEINIFASQLHAHLTGRKLFTSHWRDGRKLGEINRDNHYSPHWQHIQSLSKHIKVLPGDVLATTCVYETLSKKNWTWGGYGIEDEMCVNYVHYYPAVDVEVCKSAVSNASLHAFFSKLGVPNKNGLSIHEKYLAVEWNAAKIDLLKELYHVSPQNMAYLGHNGKLLDPDGNGTDWSRVPRPDFNSNFDPFGYQQQDDTDEYRNPEECFALND